MDPFSVVLTVLAHTAIQSVIEGKVPAAAAWAEAANAVLDALVAGRATTSATLDRIEAKLDSLRRDQFDRPFKAGLHFLGEAQPSWRKERDREQLLAEARSRFIDAAAAAADDLEALVSYWYLAVTWLLSRSPNDCRLYLARAADRGFEALVQAATCVSDPPLDAVKDRAERARPHVSFLDRLLLMESWTSEFEARSVIRQEALSYIHQARHLLLGVQRTRRQLGVPANAIPIPRVTPLWNADAEGRLTVEAEVIVDLTLGVPRQIGPLSICVHRAVMGERRPGFHRVDCELAFELDPQVPKHRWTIALLDEPNAEARTTQAGKVYYIPRPSRMLGQSSSHAAQESAPISAPLPGGAILASGRAHSPGGGLTLTGGGRARGWLRLTSWGKPLAVEIRGGTHLLARDLRPGQFTMHPRFVMLAPIGGSGQHSRTAHRASARPQHDV